MRILFLDCSSAGISGDMTIGALCDLGVKPSTLEWELSKLDIGDFHMHFERAKRQEIEGIKFDIHEGSTHQHGQGESHEHSDEHSHKCCDHDHDHAHDHSHDQAHDHSHDQAHDHSHDHAHDHSHDHAHDHSHDQAHDHSHDQAHDHSHDQAHDHSHDHAHDHSRTHRQIRELILHSELSEFVKKHALGIFQRIAVAEGKIHGQPPEDVHFHEVGALDSIADIVCACVGIEALGVDKVHVSQLNEGHGHVHCAHGIFPVPTPATLEILKGIPLGQIDEPHELITPTGAAILAEFGASFGLMPRIKVEKIGYGLGTRHLKARPNVLRAVLGELSE